MKKVTTLKKRLIELKKILIKKHFNDLEICSCTSEVIDRVRESFICGNHLCLWTIQKCLNPKFQSKWDYCEMNVKDKHNVARVIGK